MFQRLTYFVFLALAPTCVAQAVSPELPGIERIATAVGQIISTDRDAETKGSGVIISPDGLVVTCYHVLGRAGKSGGQILFQPVEENGIFHPPDARNTFRLRVVRTMPEYDLALLRIQDRADSRPLAADQKFPFLKIGQWTDLRLLDTVYIVGFPAAGGQTITVIEGHVAGKDISNQWLKLDASLSRGYSGGAVVNRVGELVGVPAEIRADIDDLRETSGESRVLYGLLSWVRPSEVVTKLLISSRSASLTSSVLPAMPRSASTGTIEGVIQLTDGTPLNGALVGLLKAESTVATADNLLTYAHSGLNGEFVLRANSGKYVLRTHSKGYENTTQAVEVNGNLRITISVARQTMSSPKNRERTNEK